MLMMQPDCRFSISRPAACENRNVPVRLVSMTFCHLSSGIVSGSAAQLMPALLIRMSIFPNAAIVLSTTAWTCSGTETSQTMPSTLKPRLAKRCRASASATVRGGRTSSATRRLPRGPRPSPRRGRAIPPVTIATRPVRSKSSVSEGMSQIVTGAARNMPFVAVSARLAKFASKRHVKVPARLRTKNHFGGSAPRTRLTSSVK